MSEESGQEPPKPTKKTSAVPLKKETVRVTLKAKPEEAEEQQEAQEAPEASSPSAPARKAPPPAPTIPLKTAPISPDAPKPPAPAPTIQLRTGGAGAPKSTPLKTQPLTEQGASGTQQLPKATVQLGSATQALGQPTGLAQGPAAGIHTVAEEEDEGAETLPYVLSIVAFVLALAVLGLQLMTANTWLSPEPPVNGPGWEGLLQ